MGYSGKTFPEADFGPHCRRLVATDLDERLYECTPAVDRAVSRTELGMECSAGESWWSTAPLFRDLSPAECARIVTAAVQRRYMSREFIVQEGDAGGQVLLAASGSVKVSQVSHTGDEVILRVARAGDVIGGLGMPAAKTYSSTARAVKPSTILSWKTQEFDQLCAKSPVLQRNALQIMHDALRVLQDCFCELATLKVASRLARTLLRLAEQSGDSSRDIPIDFTCEELGQMTGTTLFTVSRLLSKWTEMGLLYTENRGVIIEDLAGILEIADENRGSLTT